MAGRLAWEGLVGRLGMAASRGGGGGASGDSAVSVRSLCKDYGSRRALAGVSFEVARGEVFSLLGPNGTGKTTTVEILEGFRTATSGQVRVLGFDPAGQPAELRSRIGVVLQECGFPSHVRVGELVDAWRAYYEHPRPLGELLEVVELAGQAHQVVRQLSGGQRRRLDLALALAGDPDLVFLDEPTTGFDPEARRRCWAAIENLAHLGKTILLTTHYIEEAARLADRVAILAGGVVTALGTPAELCLQAGLPTRITFRLPEGTDPGTLRLPLADVSGAAGSVTVASADPAADLRVVLAWASRRHLDLGALSVAPPSLEEAYLALVGTEGDHR